jgi:hypothetical protein
LSDAELMELEALIPCPLPDEARDMLAYARGFDGGPLESLDFGGLMPPLFEETFPCALPIGHDGFGNYWVVDLTRESIAWGPILYLCHDPPVVAYQCAEVATFIADVLRLAEAPFESPLDDVHERYVMRIWKENPAADDEVRNFAQTLTPDYFVVDLRDARTGDGFSWGRFGPRTPVTRAGNERIFAYAKVSRKSRLRAFFGR